MLITQELPIRTIARLRALTHCSETTILRWWRDPDRVRPATRQRLKEAAQSIDLMTSTHTEGAGAP